MNLAICRLMGLPFGPQMPPLDTQSGMIMTTMIHDAGGGRVRRLWAGPEKPGLCEVCRGVRRQRLPDTRGALNADRSSAPDCSFPHACNLSVPDPLQICNVQIPPLEAQRHSTAHSKPGQSVLTPAPGQLQLTMS